MARRNQLFQHGERLGSEVASIVIGTVIGSGGMGEVYEAYDESLRRKVAVKAAPPELGGLLREEGRALAAFQHPAIVAVHALGQHRGIDYLVMERLHGVNLYQHLYGRVARGEQLAIDEVVDILIGIADGLALVHRAGGAHRDLKPGNVMLAPGNRVVILDFGLFTANVDSRDQGPSGTPAYMAPETVLGREEAANRALVDLYALGVISYELLVGEFPYPEIAGQDVLQRKLHEPLPALVQKRPDTPPALAALTMSLLALEPEARSQTADAVAWSLRVQRQHGSMPPDGSLSVVVVDDDDHAAKLLEFYVRESAPGALVRVASTAEAGLALVESRVPDLLVVDLQLPGMNGLEMAMYMRGTHRFDACRVVAISGRAAGHDVQLLHELGLTDFIPKGPELRTRVAAIVKDTVRLRRQLATPLGRIQHG